MKKVKMKKVIYYFSLFIAVSVMITLIVMYYGPRHRANPSRHYINYKVIIVEKGGYSERNGKHNNKGNYFLVRSVEDTTLFTELNGYNFRPFNGSNGGSAVYGSSLYYSKNVGDTLFFKYIGKNRFWRKINK